MASARSVLDREQMRKAVAALMKYIGKEKAESKELFDDDEFLYVLLALKKAPQRKPSDKPVRIAVPHALYTAEGAEVCLIVKDHKGEGHKEAKKRVKQAEIASIAKVVGVSKLRTKYESHEARRILAGAYDLFVADERVIPSLPKLLGKAFFRKKKQPVPVDLRGRDWGAQIERACAATYLHPAPGTSVCVRAARSSFSEVQCMENIAAVIAGAVEHIPRKWANIQALFLKTSDSVALPIYQMTPATPQRIRVPKADAAAQPSAVAAEA